jgi:hypothetical protein
VRFVNRNARDLARKNIFIQELLLILARGRLVFLATRSESDPRARRQNIETRNLVLADPSIDRIEPARRFPRLTSAHQQRD